MNPNGSTQPAEIVGDTLRGQRQLQSGIVPENPPADARSAPTVQMSRSGSVSSANVLSDCRRAGNFNHLVRLCGLRRRAALRLSVEDELFRLYERELQNLAASATLARNSSSSAIAISRSQPVVFCVTASLPPVLETAPEFLPEILGRIARAKPFGN